VRLAVFRSDLFRPYLPDDCQVNPNALGFELAEWLSRRLAEVNVITSYPGQEDWGWYLEQVVGDDEYLICCGGSEDGGEYEWRVFVDRPRRWFRRPPPTPHEAELFDAVIRLLQAHRIDVTVEPVVATPRPE
jgi:hypothetical protein